VPNQQQHDPARAAGVAAVSVADSAAEEFYGLQAGELQWFGFTSVARLQAEFEITGLLTPDGGRLNR